MGRYNTFQATVSAADGSGELSCEFQAPVGVLDYRTIAVGERVLETPVEDVRGLVGPSLEALSGERPFWVYGIGVCGGDESIERCAKLYFRDGVFVSAELVPCPDNLEEWGFEEA
jgi:hypothetical protein